MEIQRKVERVLYSKTPAGKAEIGGIQQRVMQCELDMEDAKRLMDETELSSTQTYKDELTVQYLEEHYYLPVLYATRGTRLEYIRHIIDEPSEAIFLSEVIAARAELAGLDWWMFSKIDHTADAVSIPYFDPSTGNAAAEFYPDFVFWGQRGDAYTIVFVDPKGMAHADYLAKVDGFKLMFEEAGKPKRFTHEGLEVTVRLFLFNRGANAAPADYKRFWRSSAKAIFADAFTAAR